MNSSGARRFDLAARTYIALAAVVAFALWTADAFDGPRTHRIPAAIVLFAIVGMLPSASGSQRYLAGLLRLLSALALSALVMVLYWSAR